MTTTRDEQQKLWNGPAGRAWVDAQAILDRLFEPFEELLADAVSGSSVSRVLDVGCGTGSTTLAAARRLGAKGRSVGVDISEPMIAMARDRAAQAGLPASFIVADAQTHEFEPATFDRVISRFGVMFFEDPVRAFANVRRACRESAELCVIVWRGAAENPFMTTAERAAAPLLPNLPPRRPEGPGQFAFADTQQVQRILEAAGWTDIDFRPIDVPCALPAKELQLYVTRLGPVGMLLQETEEPARTRVIEAVRAAFEPYVNGDEARFTAACWRIAARVGPTTRK